MEHCTRTDSAFRDANCNLFPLSEESLTSLEDLFVQKNTDIRNTQDEKIIAYIQTKPKYIHAERTSSQQEEISQTNTYFSLNNTRKMTDACQQNRNINESKSIIDEKSYYIPPISSHNQQVRCPVNSNPIKRNREVNYIGYPTALDSSIIKQNVDQFGPPSKFRKLSHSSSYKSIPIFNPPNIYTSEKSLSFETHIKIEPQLEFSSQKERNPRFENTRKTLEDTGLLKVTIKTAALLKINNILNIEIKQVKKEMEHILKNIIL